MLAGTKTDRHDARSAAMVALRYRQRRAVTAVDYTGVLRLLAGRQHDLTAARTRAACRLQALLCLAIPGGIPRRLSADRAAEALQDLHGLELIDIERKALATDLVTDIRRPDDQIARIKARISSAVGIADTTVTDIHGVGLLRCGHLGSHRRHRTLPDRGAGRHFSPA